LNKDLKFYINIFLLFISVNSFAQLANVQFIENKGQWENNIVFKAKLPGGNLYLEQNELTYLFYNEQDIARLGDMHHHGIKNPTPNDYLLNLHAFKIQFLNAQTQQIIPSKPTTDYENYFIGNDTSKWASKVKKYGEATYSKIYPHINLKFYVKNNYLKYDFIVASGGDVNQIQLKYNGVDAIVLKDGKLNITTSVNQIIEQKPYAYQLIKGKQKEVKCNFKLENKVVSFEFPRGYDKTKELVIDPTLIFASYSGSTADNWGYTSTFDDAGNLYGGGVTFGVGYPITVGAYQVSFNGGNGNYSFGTDISLTKFSSNGTSLLYSTYLGGSGNESPHSLIVNNNNELLVMGTTASANFPMSATAYDNTFNGGTNYTFSIPNYIGGSDIVISKFSTNGALLLASTFMGGSGNDGLNLGPVLLYNYADEFRGEIVVDTSDNVYVASSTFSTNFPVTPGAFQPALSGGQDGCAFKLSPDLSSLIWSSYLGGTNADAAFSVQFSTLGDVLVTGGTESPNFPVTVGALQTIYQGVADGWVTKINNTGTTILASTFIGTSDYDQTFFVQLDTANNVYVVGQTEGTYPITPVSVYNVPNSGQFLHKLSPDLSATLFSTTFGRGSGNVDITLSAFLVNECNYIFISGWGGAINSSNGGPPFSTTTGLPITANALQATTDGSDYYLMLLDEDAASLMYATFFGGTTSLDHVDGGTSRFDKKGIVYQAVCASCYGSTSDFPTTPGAWSNTDNGPNCNLGVFKIDLSVLTAGADVYATPFHCLGDTVHFQNLSNGGITYYWAFDDGDTSIIFEPYHVYDSLGTYHVMLVSLDSVSCLKRDTDYVDVYISGPPIINVTPINGVCRGDSIQLTASGGLIYSWTPNYNILDSNTATPTVWPDTTTTYTVVTTDSCGMDTTQLVVMVFTKNIGIMPDTMICLGQSVQIYATGGTSYVWSPAATLNDPFIVNPMATPLATTIYQVAITDSNNCVWDTLMEVAVDSTFPIALGSVPDTICLGDTVQIYASGGSTYSWTPSNTLTNPNDSMTIASPTQSTNYVVEVANACGVDYDTVEVYVHIVNANIVNDTIVCIGDVANLWATGGVAYYWYSSTGGYGASNSINPIITEPTTFNVEVTDSLNCTTTLSVFVDTLINPIVELGSDIKTNWGNVVTLNPITNGVNFWWTPSTGLSCTTCPNPMVNAQESTTYYLTVQGANGCYSYDAITVMYDGSIYAPNSFSPDGDGVNDLFYVYGKDIVEFELSIFDRWGEKLFYSTNMEMGWNGTYKGTLAKTETYVWKVKYRDILGDPGTMFGTVTLIR